MARTICTHTISLLPWTNFTTSTLQMRPTLSGDPRHKELRKEMVGRLGDVLARDSRWLGYWSSFRIDQYFDLPEQKGDMQLRAPA